MLPQKIDNLFIDKFSSVGNEKFYKYLLNYAVIRMAETTIDGISPEIEFINYYEKFLATYRREQNPVILEMAKVFRKAANKVYRLLLKKEVIDKNAKFFNIVK